MTINHQEILRMLESHDPNKELSAAIQRRQDQIKYIVEQENPDQTKDLITIAQDFKDLMNLDENELSNIYLRKKYPDFEFELKNSDIYATLIKYEGKTLPKFPSSLERLRIESCPKLEILPELPTGLEILDISICHNLKRLPEFPPGLESLEIKWCDNLKRLPEFPPGLEYLKISGCRNLKRLPEFPPGLKDLYIWDCPNIETLPEFLSSLERLRIESCPKLENVPEFPERLKGLYIEDCPNLTQETRDRIKEFQG